MSCPRPSEQLYRVSTRHRVPVACTFELTRRCNLSCVHCYIDPACRDSSAELSTAEIRAVLEQLAAAGTLYLVFTGGEIFLREDILDLCEHARKLRFDVRLFSNATLIDERRARRLAELHVSAVEISLYGAKSTHEMVTRSPGSFAALQRSLELLRGCGVPVVIKTPLMNVNFQDLPWISEFAAEIGATLRLDPVISPRDSGNTTNCAYRLNDEQLRTLFATSPLSTGSAIPDNDLTCSAGRNMLAVTADGTVYPCLQLLLPLGSLRRDSLNKIWYDNPVLDNYRKIDSKKLSECLPCELRPYCQRCPGLTLLEEGDITSKSRTACAIASLHFQRNNIA